MRTGDSSAKVGRGTVPQKLTLGDSSSEVDSGGQFFRNQVGDSSSQSADRNLIE
jgi:hypothetical protein